MIHAPIDLRGLAPRENLVAARPMTEIVRGNICAYPFSSSLGRCSSLGVVQCQASTYPRAMGPRVEAFGVGGGGFARETKTDGCVAPPPVCRAPHAEDGDPAAVTDGPARAGELDTLARDGDNPLGPEARLVRGVGTRSREEAGPRGAATSGRQRARGSRRMHMVESLDDVAPASSLLWFEAILASFLLTLCRWVGVLRSFFPWAGLELLSSLSLAGRGAWEGLAYTQRCFPGFPGGCILTNPVEQPTMQPPDWLTSESSYPTELRSNARGVSDSFRPGRPSRPLQVERGWMFGWRPPPSTAEPLPRENPMISYGVSPSVSNPIAFRIPRECAPGVVGKSPAHRGTTRMTSTSIGVPPSAGHRAGAARIGTGDDMADQPVEGACELPHAKERSRGRMGGGGFGGCYSARCASADEDPLDTPRPPKVPAESRAFVPRDGCSGCGRPGIPFRHPSASTRTMRDTHSRRGKRAGKRRSGGGHVEAKEQRGLRIAFLDRARVLRGRGCRGPCSP